MHQDDSELIQRVVTSDREAFQTLFLKYQPALHKLIYFKTRDSHLAQDIVQETFLKIWLNRNSLKPELSIFSYMARISSNLIKDHFKHLKVRDKHKDSIPQPTISIHDNPENVLDYKILREQIQQIVNNHLSETCRTIFLLSRIEDKSNNEIAETLGISTKKIENQLYYALKIIRKHLKHPSK